MSIPQAHQPEQTDRESAATRVCGECSLCCTVLRVDELGKLGGEPCPQLRDAAKGCAIYEQRPRICRAYRCMWLRGYLEERDRPDRLGAIVELLPVGTGLRLSIHEATPGAYDRSDRLQKLAASHRETIPVRIADVVDVENPDRPYRVLLARGEEQRVTGDRTTQYRDGVRVGERRLPWLDRAARRLQIRLRTLRLRVARRRSAPAGRGPR